MRAVAYASPSTVASDCCMLRRATTRFVAPWNASAGSTPGDGPSRFNRYCSADRSSTTPSQLSMHSSALHHIAQPLEAQVLCVAHSSLRPPPCTR